MALHRRRAQLLRRGAGCDHHHLAAGRASPATPPRGNSTSACSSSRSCCSLRAACPGLLSDAPADREDARPLWASWGRMRSPSLPTLIAAIGAIVLLEINYRRVDPARCRRADAALLARPRHRDAVAAGSRRLCCSPPALRPSDRCRPRRRAWQRASDEARAASGDAARIDAMNPLRRPALRAAAAAIVHKRFGATPIIRGVSLDVRTGRAPRDHRTERRGQVDAVQSDQRALRADDGLDTPERREICRARRRIESTGEGWRAASR